MEIFDYDNILLLPRKCRVESRSECDAGVELGGRKFRLPVVPANMKTVVDENICLWMAQNNYFYVMHRFDLDNVQFVRDMHGKGVYASISLGVKAPDRATVDQLAADNLVDGELFKEYYGSASDFNKGEYKHVEGKRILEPIKGKLANTLIEMEQDVQSSISYAGGTKLMDIRKVNYVTLGGDNAGEHLL
eukprot:gene4902-4801_t